MKIKYYLCKKYQENCMMKPMNRLKAVLAEQHRTGKWLAKAVGRNEATVSRWCTNSCQPPMEMIYKIAKLLDVDVKDLLNSINDDGKKQKR
jgi:DNA-binding XRE family transcriptional regulator